jgi:hypothetical protein
MARLVQAALVCLTLTSQARAAEPVKEDIVAFEATLEGDGQYMVGEPIFATLKFTGLRNEPVGVAMGHMGRRAISVVYQGRTSHSGFLDTCPGGTSRIYRGEPARGQTFEHRILLNEWVALKRPGRHRLRIIYDASRTHRPDIAKLRAECDLALRVVPKDPPKLTQVLSDLYAKGAGPGDPGARDRCVVALCYSGAEESLPFLRKLIEMRYGRGGGEGTELFKGIRRVGTVAALELLGELMDSPDGWTSHMAMVQVGLIERETTDKAVKARAQELLKRVPEGFRFVEPQILN